MKLFFLWFQFFWSRSGFRPPWVPWLRWRSSSSFHSFWQPAVLPKAGICSKSCSAMEAWTFVVLEASHQPALVRMGLPSLLETRQKKARAARFWGRSLEDEVLVGTAACPPPAYVLMGASQRSQVERRWLINWKIKWWTANRTRAALGTRLPALAPMEPASLQETWSRRRSAGSRQGTLALIGRGRSAAAPMERLLKRPAWELCSSKSLRDEINQVTMSQIKSFFSPGRVHFVCANKYEV